MFTDFKMKQLLQNIKIGRNILVDVPAPLCQPEHVLIVSRASLISVGTERMMVDFRKAGWVEKAMQATMEEFKGCLNDS